MNELERKMVATLIDLRENHHVIGVKAEFEAEGTRMEEALRLKEVVTAAGLGMTLKIGGCEALRDMYEARVIGVDRVVAPMVESPYALKKFLKAVRMAFPADERDQVHMCINIETVTGVANFDAMLALHDIDELDGIVLGRTDMCGSLGLTPDDINDPRILEIARDLFMKAKTSDLDCAMGGGVSAHSLPFLRSLAPGTLHRFETRKVIFRCPEAHADGAEAGILKAVGFELMWLKNKRSFYSAISEEDNHRIDVLESRYKHSIEQAGGRYE